jgi:serine/threonine-protein kinase 24/25/MST4
MPLGLDMSFGNSPSSTRPFRRVSSGGHEKKRLQERDVSNNSIVEPRTHGLDREKSVSNASTLVGSDENTPPACPFEDKFKEIPIPVKPIQVTKESLLGRRAYSKIIDSTFQEQHAQTGDLEKREAIARLHNAWTVLDRIDPEGEFLLLRSLIENLKEDPKLSTTLGLSSALSPSTPISSPVKQSHTKPAAGFQPSPTKASMAPPSAPPTPRHRQTQSVSNIEISAATPSTPNGSKQRLVLAQNNPHLKSHRRRQSALVETDLLKMQEKQVDERRLPGYVPQGMEQAGGFADVLYSRWLDGLKARWGMA